VCASVLWCGVTDKIMNVMALEFILGIILIDIKQKALTEFDR
jgi:hypothetical protein